MGTRTEQPEADRTKSDATLALRGPFSVRESALFGFGYTAADDFDGVMRLAFRVDGGYEEAAGVEVRQPADDRLELTIEAPDAPGTLQRVVAQVARILSVDHDATGFVDLGRRDPVIGALQAVAPGLRPPQFSSPYEALVWAAISHRRNRAQGIRVRQALAVEHGDVFQLAGIPVTAAPAPSRLLAVTAVPGLPADRVPRLHAIATAAQAGDLEVDHLIGLGPEEAKRRLRALPGIGPFYAALVVVRALGLTDVIPTEETISRKAIERLYDLQPLADSEVLTFAERWAPWRTWATVLIRAAEDRLPLQGPS